MFIKVLSYNIHKGFNWSNQNYVLHEVKALIEETGADLAFLQEVVGENVHLKQNGLVDEQFEFLADDIWDHYSYARNAVYDHGHHGNLILSRFPIQAFENIDLSTNRFEQRGLLICRIVIPLLGDTEIYAMCLHLNLTHQGRRAQYRKIEEELGARFQEARLPTIMAGDLNDWNRRSAPIIEDTLGMGEVHKTIHGDYARTFPSFLPFLTMDRIYVKDMRVVNSRVMRSRHCKTLSDHLPIYCELEIDG